MEIYKAELFESLVQDAIEQPFSGWDFSYLNNRWFEERPPWGYRQKVIEAFQGAQRCLDMGTGGGELLETLVPLPSETYATEVYPPNVPVAKSRLEPLRVAVVPVETQAYLPFEDGFFDLVINRHETFFAGEVMRILRPGGLFITQQVGELNLVEINRFLGADPVKKDSYYDHALCDMEAAGFEILENAEAFLESEFSDVGALVYLLKAVPWQIPDFSVEKYRDRLIAIHNHIEKNGTFRAHDHRFFIKGKKDQAGSS
jgi:SAM-dependent methyltransferase